MMAIFVLITCAALLSFVSCTGPDIKNTIGNPATSARDVNTRLGILEKAVEDLKEDLKECRQTDGTQNVEIALVKYQLQSQETLLKHFKETEFTQQNQITKLENSLTDAVKSISDLKTELKAVNKQPGVFTGSNDEKWTLVFKGSRGNGQSVFDFWKSTRFTLNPTSDHSQMTSHCACHYKSHLVEKWGSLPIKKVAFILYKDNEAVLQLLFNGEHTDKINWFTQSRLLEDPWNDLNATYPHKIQMFSADGHNKLNRRWFINYSYNGCPNDIGWLTIHDGPREDCLWERGAPWPTFLYSPLPNNMKYEDDIPGMGRADVMAVYVQM